MKQWLFLSGYVRRRFTLRVRLMLWMMGLLLVASVTLLVFVNMAVPIVGPLYERAATGEIRRATFALILMAEEPEGICPQGEVSLAEAVLLISAVRKDVFRQIHTVSFIGLGLIVALGGIGSYWLAGRALRPLHKLAGAAQEIDAKTLDIRLELEHPEDELYQLAGSFNAMLNRLEASFQQQGRFVADAAHELRTPLATIRASLDVVRADPNATIEHHHAMNATIERARTRLQRLVDDLLLLATGGYISPDAAIAIAPILEDVMLDLKPLASEHSVTLKLTGNTDLMTRGDPTLLARVFHNLMENGIRYNRQAGEVVVNTYAEGESVVLIVADTGIGIPAEQQSRIFDRFYRVDLSRSRNKGGAGLGLSIARHIVESHGGELSVESTAGVGSTFMVKLPLYSSPDIMD